MKKTLTGIAGAYLLQPQIFTDDRGYFMESWNLEKFRRIGFDVNFVQDNYSRSRRGVLRGLHYQSGDSAQGKLVWVSSGRVFDVIVDLRRSSPTFGKWYGCVLDAEKHELIWVPPGCAHGFLALSETVDFHYKVTAAYSAEAERCLRWDDPRLGITWPLQEGQKPALSAKDAVGHFFGACEEYG